MNRCRVVGCWALDLRYIPIQPFWGRFGYICWSGVVLGCSRRFAVTHCTLLDEVDFDYYVVAEPTLRWGSERTMSYGTHSGWLFAERHLGMSDFDSNVVTAPN